MNLSSNHSSCSSGKGCLSRHRTPARQIPVRRMAMQWQMVAKEVLLEEWGLFAWWMEIYSGILKCNTRWIDIMSLGNPCDHAKVYILGFLLLHPAWCTTPPSSRYWKSRSPWGWCRPWSKSKIQCPRRKGGMGKLEQIGQLIFTCISEVSVSMIDTYPSFICPTQVSNGPKNEPNKLYHM